MILLIEDSTDDAELTRYAFAKAGITVPLVTLGDGATAVAFFEGTGIYADQATRPCPALVLLDLKLPRRSGYDVLRAARANAATRHVPVVVLTSSSREADIRRAYEAGANSYLVKPLEREALLGMVRSLDGFWLRFNRNVGA
ncbi:MAG: putative response regulator, CheY [Rhodospirillales bacterium]|jgi:DNA-binding response OmpR family regulator|nr:putative response regulator, CheY [Rhodospirillales bacterium]MDB5383643.1 putative response regulator, CheY [Rhodospirillales bacterium]